MMVPPWIATALEVVEAELTLQVFVCSLGPPALFDMAYQFPELESLRQVGEMILTGSVFPVFPFLRFPLVSSDEVWGIATIPVAPYL